MLKQLRSFSRAVLGRSAFSATWTTDAFHLEAAPPIWCAAGWRGRAARRARRFGNAPPSTRSVPRLRHLRMGRPADRSAPRSAACARTATVVAIVGTLAASARRGVFSAVNGGAAAAAFFQVRRLVMVFTTAAEPMPASGPDYLGARPCQILRDLAALGQWRARCRHAQPGASVGRVTPSSTMSACRDAERRFACR
jgi:hypothetical protein